MAVHHRVGIDLGAATTWYGPPPAEGVASLLRSCGQRPQCIGPTRLDHIPAGRIGCCRCTLAIEAYHRHPFGVDSDVPGDLCRSAEFCPSSIDSGPPTAEGVSSPYGSRG
ncbi:hypothetical protein SDC9_188776 [bioreactor metagenome]|uniref:Uncharacterized protein n=1 Tax=bioreactor metagenome TaxID=1076179 RepID=A0A645HYI3_9ZZZZ